MKAHRGTLILVLGILGLLLCGPFTGIPAWIMGRGDLKEIEGGLMDPTGRDLTKIGMILGIVSSALFILSIIAVVILLALGVLGAAFGMHAR